MQSACGANDALLYLKEIASGKTLAELIQGGWRPSEDEVSGYELVHIRIILLVSNIVAHYYSDYIP